MNTIWSRLNEIFRLNRLQRVLLLGASGFWVLFAAAAMQRDELDAWILDGILWPFAGFVLVCLALFWLETDTRINALQAAWGVLVCELIPSFKYVQPYGQSNDAVVHYVMLNDLITSGRTADNVYQSIAGMHSWLASLGLTAGLTAADTVKFGFPAAAALLPLIYYFICRKLGMPSRLTKYTLGLGCLAAYPIHFLTGTGFSLEPLFLFLGILLVRDREDIPAAQRLSFTIIALITLIQLTIWHSTTPLLLLAMLVSVSFTPVVADWLSGQNRRQMVNRRFAQMVFLAVTVNIGYHAFETDPVFKVLFSRLYQFVTAQRQASSILPASVFKLNLMEALQVFLVMYGRDALLFGLAGIGALLLLRQRQTLDHSLLTANVYWLLTILIFAAAVPLSLMGVDFRRFLWIPLAITPFLGAFTLVWWQKAVLQPARTRLFSALVSAAILGGMAVFFVLEFYTCQPLVPKAGSLDKTAQGEYSVWLHQVNSAYQQRMIIFAQQYSSPSTQFAMDVFGNRQFIRYFGGINGRGLFLPLMPNSGWGDASDLRNGVLYLLHWPGKAGGYGEQVQFRSLQAIQTLSTTPGWSQIYDNGESFILLIP